MKGCSSSITAQARWSWDLDRIHAKATPTTWSISWSASSVACRPIPKTALRQLACLGYWRGIRSAWNGLREIAGDLHDSLWEAVRAGLVLRSDDSYAFQHDRIQEAAYSLIPEDARAEAHLRIGRLLLAHTPPDKREEIDFRDRKPV